MKLASYVGTRDSIVGLGSRLIRLRLSGIRQALQTDNTSFKDPLRASHSEIVFEPGDGVDDLMPDGTCRPNEKGELWCVSSVGLERIPHFSTRRAGKRGGAYGLSALTYLVLNGNLMKPLLNQKLLLSGL